MKRIRKYLALPFIFFGKKILNFVDEKFGNLDETSNIFKFILKVPIFLFGFMLIFVGTKIEDSKT